MKPFPPISEGALLYVLGLVVIATRPGQFWLGIALAITPLAIGAAGRAFVRDWRL